MCLEYEKNSSAIETIANLMLAPQLKPTIISICCAL